MNDLPMLLSAALIALHAQSQNKLFRQRDVKFFIELFTNWIEYAGKFDSLKIHNTQIAREMQRLSKDGTLKRRNQDAQPVYLLTPIGLITCLRNIFHTKNDHLPQHLFFRLYFLSNYSERIRILLKSSQQTIPSGIKLEIDPLLDYKQLVQDALKQAKRNRERLELRITDAYKMAETATQSMKKDSWEDTVKKIEALYPYELNSMKPLSALCANLPEEIAKWELTEGSVKRVNQLWKPLLNSLIQYIEELENVSNV